MSEQFKISVGLPGPHVPWQTLESLFGLFRSKHQVSIGNAATSWDNFNVLWCAALEQAERGDITHFAMLHTDVFPIDQEPFVDTLLAEMQSHNLDLISCPVAIKDDRGLTSSGLGQDNHWEPWRRFTVREILDLPETFTAADIGYPDRPLLHNNGCWLADMRCPVFHQTDADGYLLAWFDFPKRIRKIDGAYKVQGESEDWFFSRKLWELGCRTGITRKVRLNHRGANDFPNYEAWGSFINGDEDTASNWREKKSEAA